MRDALKSYLALAGGVSELTRQRAVAAAKALVNQGEATAEQVGALAEDLLAQTKQNREAVIALVTYEVDRTLARVGLAQADEVEQLTQRVRTLEAQLRAAGLTPGTTAPTTAGTDASAQKAPARKAPAQKAPAQKAPAQKAPAQKAPAQKAPGQKTAANLPGPGQAAAAPTKKTPKKTPKKAAPRKRPARAAGPAKNAGATTPDA